MDNNTQQNSGQAPTMTAKAEEHMNALEASLAPIFEKFPHLPEKGRQVLVDIAPWVALIFGILGVLALLAAGGLGLVATIFTFGLALPVFIPVILGLISSILLLLAFNPLKAHEKKGWNYVFYSQVVGIIAGIVGIFFARPDIVTNVIGAIIGFYILFEIRSHYK